ncbi:MAG: enoyl-CoA hydratase/isomerase family protein, partial [Bacteroidota bacterium]
KSDEKRTIWENDEAGLIDLGNGVALYEFRSKSNSLGTNVMAGLFEVIDLVENSADWRGLVIGNEGRNFSVGANLGEVAMGVMMGQFGQIEKMIAKFQEAVLRIRYAAKPVVVCTHGMALGGGCEMTLASPHPVASMESYIGLVELGVGLIPAGTGTAHMAAWAGETASTDFPSDVQTKLRQAFEQIAMAKVATSAQEAQDFGYLPPEAVIVMNADRRFHVAKQEVVRLSEEGYAPPPRRTSVHVLGRPGRAQFEAALYQFRAGNFISDYDRHLASRLAHVLTGGDLTGPAHVDESYLVDLEREVFLSLLGEQKTMERIQHILTTNKPLRN